MTLKKLIIAIAILGLIAGGGYWWSVSKSDEGTKRQHAEQNHDEAPESRHADGGQDEHGDQPSGEHEEGGHVSRGQEGGNEEKGHEDHDEKAALNEESHDKHGEKVVTLTPEQLAQLDVRVKSLPAGSITSELTRPATVRFNRDRTARVGPRIGSKVVRVIRDLGDRVKAGDTLALMSSVELGKARSHYLTARARLETARANYNREQELFEKKISSEAEMQEARAQFKQAEAELTAARETLRLYGISEAEFEGIKQDETLPLSYFYLTSPMSGVIQKRDLSPGQTVGPDETPVHVVDNRIMWVFIDAYEQDVVLLESGLPVELSVRSLPGQRFEGRIDWVSGELDETTRTVRVRAVVDNPGGTLRAGMFGTAMISTEGQAKRAIIPVDAVQTIDGESFVFVPGHERGRYRAVAVKTGEENNGRVEIVSGLAPGKEAVVAGAFDLKSAFTAKSRSAAHNH